MYKRQLHKWNVACGLFFVVFNNVLAKEELCKSGCHGASQTFKYTTGKTYKYNFDGKIDFTLSSAEGQVTTTRLKAQVLLRQEALCNQILSLRNIKVIGQNGKEYGQLPDIEKPIRLNFHDGHIEDTICTVPGDNQNSLNIKRAIASLFQADLKSSSEIDVFGKCPTEINQFKRDKLVYIQKNRDLNKCQHRESLYQNLITTTFNINTESKSSSILKSHYYAKMQLKDGILEYSNVTENYLYSPFSIGDKGAKAQVISLLKLTGISTEKSSNNIIEPKSIIFENPNFVDETKSNIPNILHALKIASESIDSETITMASARNFISLIKIIKCSKKSDLISVYDKAKSEKNLFLEAILRSGNAGAIEAGIELLKNGKLSSAEEKRLYLGMGTRNVVESTLNSILDLLKRPNVLREAYWGISNLVKQFCHDNSCKNSQSVNKIISHLITLLENNRPTSRNEENRLIYIIKSLGNFLNLSDALLSKLVNIVEDKLFSTRIRVTVLQTFKSSPCQDKLRESSSRILQDTQEDPEIRIKAYLVLAGCPNSKIASTIKHLLQDEPSYQVGGFIVSHIRNIRHSGDPNKQLAREYLGPIDTPMKYPFDFRKWSFNTEFSYSIERLGMANIIESNVIFSQNSFLPRSTSLTLTAEIFGQSFKFLEIQSRQENLEKLIEYYFGPRGAFKGYTFGELYKNFENFSDKIFQQYIQKLNIRLKAKHDLSDDVEKIEEQIQISKDQLGSTLDLDFTVKIFGTELVYINLGEEAVNLTPEAIVDKLVDQTAKSFNKIKKFQDTFRSSELLLDLELSYPTSLGFPLRLAVEGFSNLKLQAKGNVDINQSKNQEEKFENFINLGLIPSVNVEITGRLTLDTHFLENGLKLISTFLYTTGSEVAVSYRGKLKKIPDFGIKFSFPVDEQKLLSLNHQIVFHSRELAENEVNIPLRFPEERDFTGCFDHLSSFTGFIFCVTFNGPNILGENFLVVRSPLSGNSFVELSVSTKDVLEYYFQYSHSGDQYGFEIKFNILNRQNKEMVSFIAMLDVQNEETFKINFTLPQKTIEAKALNRYSNKQWLLAFNVKYGEMGNKQMTIGLETVLNDGPKEKSVLIRIGDGYDEYFGKVGVVVIDERRYKPILEVKVPGGSDSGSYKIVGEILSETNGPLEDTYDINHKYTLKNLKLKNEHDESVLNIDGYITQRGLFFGHSSRAERSMQTDITLSSLYEKFTFKSLHKLSSQKASLVLEVDDIKNSRIKFKIMDDLDFAPDQIENKFAIIHGSDLNSRTNRLSLNNFFKRRFENVTNFEIATKNQLIYPVLGLDVKLEFEQDPQSLIYDAFFKLHETVIAGLSINLEYGRVDIGNYGAEFWLQVLSNKFGIKSRRQIEGFESRIENSVEFNGKRIQLEGKVKHRMRPLDVDIGMDLVLNFVPYSVTYKIKNGLLSNQTEFKVFGKLSRKDTDIFDTILIIGKSGDSEGKLKLDIKNVLQLKGEFKSETAKSKGKGKILIDIPKSKEQMKSELAFEIESSKKCNVDFILYPSFIHNKEKRYKFSSRSIMDRPKYESKNVLDLNGLIFFINAKGIYSNTLENMETKFELDMSTPNRNILNGKLEHKSQKIIGFLTVVTVVYLELKSEYSFDDSLKIKYEHATLNAKPVEDAYDTKYRFEIIEGYDKLQSEVNVRRSVEGSTVYYELKSKFYDSLRSQRPLEFGIKLRGDLSTNQEFNVVLSHEQNLVFFLKGKYINIHQFEGNIALELRTSVTPLEELKLNGELVVSRQKHIPSIFRIQNRILIKDLSNYQDHIMDASGEINIMLSDNAGIFITSLKNSDDDPITGKIHYALQEINKNNYKFNLGWQLSGNMYQEFIYDFVYEKFSEFENRISISIPDEPSASCRIIINNKQLPEGKGTDTNIEFTSRRGTWILSAKLTESMVSPVVDIKLKAPDGRISEAYLKLMRIEETYFGGEVKLIHEFTHFNLEGDIELFLESSDDFYVKGNIHSPSLNLDKITLDAYNSVGRSRRRIQINVKSKSKVIVSGSTSYNLQDKPGKQIFEGTGTFKINGESKSVNYKYITKELKMDKDSERGYELTMDAGVGNTMFSGEFKISNKHFRIQKSYCTGKKDCAHIEIDSKNIANGVRKFDHIFEINADLRKFGLLYACGWKGTLLRRDFVIDLNSDIYCVDKGSKRYRLSSYLHPLLTGISLTMPKRQICLEWKVDFTRDNHHINIELAFYLNKLREPNKKASLSAWYTFDSRSGAFENGVQFNTVDLPRPISIVFSSRSDIGEDIMKLDFDIFEKNDQKLTIAYKVQYGLEPQNIKLIISNILVIKSLGLNIDIRKIEEGMVDVPSKHYRYVLEFLYNVNTSKYDVVLSSEGHANRSKFLFQLKNVTELLLVDGKRETSQKHELIQANISAFEGRYRTSSKVTLEKYNSLNASFENNFHPSDKIFLTASLIPQQLAKIRLEKYAKQPLFTLITKLDDETFEQKIDIKGIFNALKVIAINYATILEDVVSAGDKLFKESRYESKNLQKIFKDVYPNFTPAGEAFVKEAEVFFEEIRNDETLLITVKTLAYVFSPIGDLFYQITAIKSVINTAIVQPIIGIITDIYHKFDKEMEDIFSTLSKNLFEVIFVVLLDEIEWRVNWMKRVSEDYLGIKEIETAVKEIMYDICKSAVLTLTKTVDVIANTWEKFSSDIHNLPGAEEMTKIYNSIPKLLNKLFNEVTEILRKTSSNVLREFGEFIDSILNYIWKKLNNKNVDGSQMIEELFDGVEEIFRKNLESLTGEDSIGFNYKTLELPTNIFNYLWSYTSTQFSLLKYLLNENISGYFEFLLTFVNKPKNWFAPFPLFAMVVQGQHLFTFDGKHIILPGKCSYLLARDTINGSFNLIGTYKNGLLTAISLFDDTDKLTIELGGKVFLNNANVELPTEKGNLSAYINYNLITLKTVVGASVECTTDLLECNIEVSGFYHGHLRGILGNGNNEPYDDLTLPNGTIVSSETIFCNSYKIESTCEVVNTIAQKFKPHPSCGKLFSWDSPLALCYPFVNQEKYKSACEYGLEAGKDDTEASIAQAYVSLCNQRGILIRVPPEYAQCKNSDKPHRIGATFYEKLPGNSADIVLLVDTDGSNQLVYKELVKPLAQQLNKELKSNGIGDVQYSLITYGGENKWPTLLTVKGKLIFNDKLPDLKFASKPEMDNAISRFDYINNFKKSFNNFVHSLNLAVGDDSEGRAFEKAFKYPFRTNAIKSVICLTSKPTEVGQLSLVQKLKTSISLTGPVFINYVTSFKDITVKDLKHTKEAIGFNAGSVFTISDKSNYGGSSELYKDLKYDDFRVDHIIRNRGNVFLRDNFITAKGSQRKQFVSVVSQNIVRQLTGLEQELECECKYINQFFAMNVCKES